MSKFDRLIAAIGAYDNDIEGMKPTSHHSAVSVRVDAMQAALGETPAERSEDASEPIARQRC